MSVKSKMTAIADRLRAMLGTSDPLTLDGMSAALDAHKEQVVDGFEAVLEMGGTAPSSPIMANMPEAIKSIPKGVTVQRNSGTFTTSTSGTATVNVGFQPDLVAFSSGQWPNGNASYPGFPFKESGQTKIEVAHMPSDTSSYVMSITVCTRTSTGFTVSMTKVSTSMAASADSNRRCSWVAVKYS